MLLARRLRFRSTPRPKLKEVGRSLSSCAFTTREYIIERNVARGKGVAIRGKVGEGKEAENSSESSAPSGKLGCRSSDFAVSEFARDSAAIGAKIPCD